MGNRAGASRIARSIHTATRTGKIQSDLTRAAVLSIAHPPSYHAVWTGLIWTS